MHEAAEPGKPGLPCPGQIHSEEARLRQGSEGPPRAPGLALTEVVKCHVCTKLMQRLACARFHGF